MLRSLARSFRLFLSRLSFRHEKVEVERTDHVMSLVLTSGKQKKAGQNADKQEDEEEKAEEKTR